jgi:hypothetical protein
MKHALALGLALVALVACSSAPSDATARLHCDPRARSCDLRYADHPGTPAGFAVALPGPLLAQAAAAKPPAQVIAGASNPVFQLDADYSHPEEAEIADVGKDAARAFTAGHWLLAGLIFSVLGLLLLRKLAPAGGKLEVWLHSTGGLWVWSTVLAVIATVVKAVADLGGTADLKTLGSLLLTAAGTVVFAKLRDAAPTPAAQAVQAAKAGAGAGA